jgi:hypothetical protein
MRAVLMSTLKGLCSKESPMALDRARAVAEVATVLVNSARVEVDYLRATHQKRGAFFERAPALPAPGGDHAS